MASRYIWQVREPRSTFPLVVAFSLPDSPSRQIPYNEWLVDKYPTSLECPTIVNAHRNLLRKYMMQCHNIGLAILQGSPLHSDLSGLRKYFITAEPVYHLLPV